MSNVCAHPNCGKTTACCRKNCPIVMIQNGNGRWQWAPRDGGDLTVHWPDGVRPGGLSGENWWDDVAP